MLLVGALVGCTGPGGPRGGGPLTYTPPTDATGDGATGSAESTGGLGSSSGGDTETSDTSDGGGSTGAGIDTGATTGAALMVECPPPGAMDCTPPPGPGCDLYGKIESCFVGKVATAVSETIAQNPTWFQEQESGETLVLPEFKDALVDTVVVKMQAERCTQRDPMDGDGVEIAVKADNTFQESFRLVTSGGAVRKGFGSYVGTCAPAFL